MGAEDQYLVSAHKKVIGMQNKVEENRCGHQPGNTKEEAAHWQVGAQGKQKLR